jgi:beta-lactamase superfamily II metal-dependent hydrolase
MLKAHFLNVGKGNCTILEFPSGRVAMVDIDDSQVTDEDSLTDPVEYYGAHFREKDLFRFVLTHPDVDHMSGLDDLARTVSIHNFWDTDNKKDMSDEDWDSSPYSKDDWNRYQELRKSKDDPRCLRLYQNATADCCWVQDNIRILSPTSRLVELANDSEEYNHLSYVLRVEHAGIVILLGGDATTEAWDEIYKTCGGKALAADIFLAPHHGSPNNVNEEVFENIHPDYVIVSVARGVGYDYDYYSQMAQKKVLTTKTYGTLRVEVSEQGDYQIYPERQP